MIQIRKEISEESLLLQLQTLSNESGDSLNLKRVIFSRGSMVETISLPFMVKNMMRVE
jgi:hypothetical protein